MHRKHALLSFILVSIVLAFVFYKRKPPAEPESKGHADVSRQDADEVARAAAEPEQAARDRPRPLPTWDANEKMPERYVALGETFSNARRATRMSFEAMKYYLPNLDRYQWYKEKNLKRESDRDEERKYLSSESFLNDFDRMFAHVSLLAVSNVGETARFQLLEAASTALALDDNTNKNLLLDRMVDALQTFPEGLKLSQEQKSSLASDKVHMVLLISRYASERVPALEGDPRVKKIFKHVADKKLALTP
jgi:hypothetical protein